MKVVNSYQYKMPAEVEVLDPRIAGKEQQQEWSAHQRRLMAALAIKGVVAGVFMFIEMVLLCVVLWALGAGSENWYRNAGHTIAYGWYMSWSFIAINATLLHAIGPDRFSSASAFLLILQLTTSSGVMSIELSNRFFYIGKGLPFFYGVRGFRALFFGSLTDKMYQNWLILTAYNVVFTPLSVWLISLGVLKMGRDLAGRPGAESAVGNLALTVAAAAV